jgi:hypothetical protein
MKRPGRLALVALAAAVLTAACAAPTSEPASEPTPTQATQTSADQGDDAPEADSQTDSERTPADPVELPQVATSPIEPGSSALYEPLPDDLPPPLVPPGELISGGPPPDGIPAIDTPRFIRVEDVTTLSDDEPVLSLELEGEARAYPVRILIWHEIVNDSIADIPFAITYCPLCNSALAFDRRLGERVLSFGTSGKLFNSDLVMYDRQTESLWPQLEGRAVIGRLTGAELDRLPIQTIRWADFREANPGAWVLSENTGYDRAYGRNPYVGYDDPSKAPFMFGGTVPAALPAKARVVGLGDGSTATAISLERLSKDRVLVVDVNGTDTVVLYEPDLTSALDNESLANSKAVGSTGAFRPEVDGAQLTFEWNGASFIDAETGSTWSILGRATEGPLAGSELEPVEYVDTFWFAWSAFQPATSVID